MCNDWKQLPEDQKVEYKIKAAELSLRSQSPPAPSSPQERKRRVTAQVAYLKEIVTQLNALNADELL